LADWSLASGFRAESFGTATGTPGGTNVVSNATAHVKGSWVQLDAATAFEAAALQLYINVHFQDTLHLLDVGVGGAGSEQVILSNLLIAQSVGVQTGVLIPINIPAGSRIAVRLQDNFGGSDVWASGMLLAGGFISNTPFNTITTYGASTATSKGTVADAGATANTKGTWAQITASTTTAIKALMVAATRATQGTSVAADYAQLMDIGVGASGSEQVLIPNFRFVVSTMNGGVTTPYTAGSGTLSGLSSLFPGIIPPILCDIPAGVRLAVRQQSSSTNANDRTSAYAIYGLG
jgi:hypothetical protein